MDACLRTSFVSDFPQNLGRRTNPDPIGSGGSAVSAAYNPLNQLTNSFGYAPTYDRRGNLTGLNGTSERVVS